MRRSRTEPGCGGSCGAGANADDALGSTRAYARLHRAPVPAAFYEPASARLRGLVLSPAASRWTSAGDATSPTIDTEEASGAEAGGDRDAFDDGIESGAVDFDDDGDVSIDETAACAEAEAHDVDDTDHSSIDAPRVLRPTFMTEWRLREAGEPSQNACLRHFMDAPLSGLVMNTCYPQPARLNTRPSGPLGAPPVERDPVVVPGHGTVRRGHTDVPLTGGGNRPYIWLWFEPLADAGCHYRWYQFVQVSLFYRGRLKFPNFDPLMVAATGRPVKFRRNTRTPRWDADYHKKDHADKKTRGAGFLPPRLGVPKHDPGRPFRETDVPGTSASVGGTTRHKGILDAPSFCLDNPPPILRCVRKVLKKSFKEQERLPGQRPAPRTRSARIVIDVRSYLTCLKNGQVVCIGYVPWTYTQSATVRFTWRDTGSPGGTSRIYKLSVRLLTCTSTLAIGDWVSPC